MNVVDGTVVKDTKALDDRVLVECLTKAEDLGILSNELFGG